MNIQRQHYLIAFLIILLLIIVLVVNARQNTVVVPEVIKRPLVVKDWPKQSLVLGQVTGVAINSQLQPVIFHRADRVFDEFTFNQFNQYQQHYLGVIRDPTVLTLDPNSGEVVKEWGRDLFYVPHGLTIDHDDNLWLTDVALHQVFKFKPGRNQPDLVFGQRFQPGSKDSKLCMPTSVAVARNGQIFIADGYCNRRILQFNTIGILLRVYPAPNQPLRLNVPHGITYVEDLNRICIADRQNERVVCPRVDGSDEKEPLSIKESKMGPIFGVTSIGSLVYAVNGYTVPNILVRGLTIDVQNQRVIDQWGLDEDFKAPHAIAACPNGSTLYVVEIGPNRVWKFQLV